MENQESFFPPISYFPRNNSFRGWVFCCKWLPRNYENALNKMVLLQDLTMQWWKGSKAMRWVSESEIKLCNLTKARYCKHSSVISFKFFLMKLSTSYENGILVWGSPTQHQYVVGADTQNFWHFWVLLCCLEWLAAVSWMDSPFKWI